MCSSLVLAVLGLLSAAGDAPRSVSGSVVDVDGKPVAEALVVIAKSPSNLRAMRDVDRAGKLSETVTLGTAKTNESGAFTISFSFDGESLDAWPASTLLVWAYRDGLALAVRRLDAHAPDAMPPPRLVMSSEVPFALCLLGSDGAPARGAGISPEWVRDFLLPGVLAQRLKTTTDDDGKATIMGLKPDDLKSIQVSSPSSGDQWLVVPRGGSTAAPTLSLAPVGQIVGRATLDKSAAVVALAMLPMVERVEPERLEECFWRGLALRSSLPADGELDFEQQKDLCSLVTLVARYDGTVARDLLQPLVPDFRHTMGSRVHANTVISHMMIGAFARADPQWAIDLVRSLPDVPDNPLESPRQIAGLYLARMLLPVGPSSGQIAGLRTLDARPSQR